MGNPTSMLPSRVLEDGEGPTGHSPSGFAARITEMLLDLKSACLFLHGRMASLWAHAMWTESAAVLPDDAAPRSGPRRVYASA